MMRLFRVIQRPEYFWRPSQIWRRLRRGSLPADEARTAWGLPVAICEGSWVGGDVRNLGVHDRIVPEAICRLLDAGERALDLGANIGQNTSMMALAAGVRGRVTAFEPGERACRLLLRSVEMWAGFAVAPVEVVRKGISSREGTGVLREIDDLGGATLEATEATGNPIAEDQPAEEVELTTLGAVLPGREAADLMKMDVEGHELAVLEGGAGVLSEHRIRDIIYEDFGKQPSGARRRLEAAGYAVFYLYPAWSRPVLAPIAEAGEWLGRARSEPNFLATRDPQRAVERFRRGGWRCLQVCALAKFPSDQAQSRD